MDSDPDSEVPVADPTQGPLAGLIDSLNRGTVTGRSAIQLTVPGLVTSESGWLLGAGQLSLRRPGGVTVRRTRLPPGPAAGPNGPGGSRGGPVVLAASLRALGPLNLRLALSCSGSQPLKRAACLQPS
jgi:hypothetical protein